MIQEKMDNLWMKYDTDGNLFDDTVQMNYIDAELLSIIELQQATIKALEARLARLEVFTGMVTPEPLPETHSAGDAPTEARAPTFAGGEAQLMTARALMEKDDRVGMAQFLTAKIGESVEHHPIENLRIFMQAEIHNLENGFTD